MRVIAAVIVILAVLIGLVPVFTDCESQGRSIALASGQTIPMKCHWTGRAELAVAVPLAGVGVLLALGRRKETQRALAIVGGLLGLMAILFPAVLIGVCASHEMICSMLMEPLLIMLGVLVLAACGLVLLRARGSEEPMA